MPESEYTKDQLIAELLEALKDALALIESYKTARYSRIASDCKAAIAKAEAVHE